MLGDMGTIGYTVNQDPLACKEIINGVLYDTNKSTKITIFHWDKTIKSVFPEDFTDNYSGALFISPKGTFFIRCNGRLYLVNEIQVKTILSTYVDEYIKYFGEVEEG